MGLSFRFFTSTQFLLWLLLFHPIFAADFTSSMQPLCHDEERSALLQFKDSLFIDKQASRHTSAYPKVASWKAENGDCCSWDGVKCNEMTGHVIMLNLTSSCLVGPINSSSSLFHLVHLQWLSLADNKFEQPIPAAIMNLSRLLHLDLSDSHFVGQIPSEILELSELEYLNLWYNTFLELQKPGLASLAKKLANLKVLDLTGVEISSSVTYILANLSSLTDLTLVGCRLQGEFPSKIFQLPNLLHLDLSDNPYLTGYLPEFEAISPLQFLRLSYTGFSSKIPDSIRYVKSLSYLDLSYSYFSGVIPSSLGNLTQMTFLDLSYNKFLGELPTSMKNLGSLEILNLGLNSFSSINSSSLSWMANLTKLTFLDLGFINLAGEVPTSLLNLTQLTRLGLDFNTLNGPIPYWLMNLNQLKELYLEQNQLTGYIPFEIGNLTQLRTLRLGSNLLEGPIPSTFFELKNLETLDLGSNKLSGTFDLDCFFLNSNI